MKALAAPSYVPTVKKTSTNHRILEKNDILKTELHLIGLVLTSIKIQVKLFLKIMQFSTWVNTLALALK